MFGLRGLGVFGLGCRVWGWGDGWEASRFPNGFLLLLSLLLFILMSAERANLCLASQLFSLNGRGVFPMAQCGFFFSSLDSTNVHIYERRRPTYASDLFSYRGAWRFVNEVLSVGEFTKGHTYEHRRDMRKERERESRRVHNASSNYGILVLCMTNASICQHKLLQKSKGNSLCDVVDFPTIFLEYLRYS